MSTPLETARKKMARWRVLRILYTGQPYPVGDGLITEIMPDADLAMTPTEVRNVLQYLADKGMVEIKIIKHPGEPNVWESRLLPQGIDFIEYNSPDEAGVSRPAKG